MKRPDARERRLVLLLCGTALRREAARDEITALAAHVDAARLIGLLRTTGLLVLAGGRLLAISDLPELARALDSHSAHARRWGVATELASLQVLDRLGAAGIRALPLKGSLLARELYGDVAARSSIDVDVLVSPQDLARAVTVVRDLGWHREPAVRRVDALPTLHETMVHPALPRVELHWRVHWYEQEFAADALARAERPAPGEPLRMQPMDGLMALMLFYARDGFSGLRFPADVASWWDLRCAGTSGPWSAEVVAQQYPALTGPVTVASRLLADLVGLPVGRSCKAPFRWRAAEGLASPFVDGGHLQAEANAGLADVLLAPPRGAGAAIRRVLDNAPVRPSPAATPTRAWGASAGHVVRVTRRWALAFPRAVLRGYSPGPPTR